MRILLVVHIGGMMTPAEELELHKLRADNAALKDMNQRLLEMVVEVKGKIALVTGQAQEGFKKADRLISTLSEQVKTLGEEPKLSPEFSVKEQVIVK